MKQPLVAALAARLRSMHAEHPLRGLCVALSGGVDSVALLVALQQARRSDAQLRRLPLRAIHIHHHLRPEADAWARHCRRLCRAQGVSLGVRHVEVPRTKGSSLEAEARRVRYAAFEAALRTGEALLTAHHEDDQLETMLLQWMRGAGVAGLAAMPACAPLGRGWLLRPLLTQSRATLEAFVQASGTATVEDDSNVDERFDRNYLRHRIVPLLRERWPAAARVASRSAAHLAEARELLDERAASDVLELAPEGALSLAKLAALSPARQRNALRSWITGCGASLPDAVHLERVRHELAVTRADAMPHVEWPGGRVRRYRGQLYCERPPLQAAAAAQAAASAAVDRLGWDWQRSRSLELGAGRGRLRLVADRHGPIDAARLPARLIVRFRAAGERIALEPGKNRRRLKELLRAAGVLPWRRDDVPLICSTKSVLAVGDWALAATLRATPATRRRLRLEWTGAGWIR